MDIKAQETYLLVKKYLSNSFISLERDEEDEIKGLVHFPLKDPTKPGGLTKRGQQWAEKNKFSELLALSILHKEKVRVDIHATLKTAELFAKSKSKGLSSEEQEVLFGGITLGSEFEILQTVKKGGKLLASGFVDKLGTLHKKLKENNLEGSNKAFLKVIEGAAIYHKKAEKEDKEMSAKMAEL